MSNRLPLRESGHRGLIAWQQAMDLAERVLDVCDCVPARAGVGLVPG